MAKRLDRVESSSFECGEIAENYAHRRRLAQVVRNGLGDRAGTCIDPKTQVVDGKTVCLVSCQRSPEPVFLKRKGMEMVPEGDFFVRSGPGTVKLPPDSAREYIRTRFAGPRREKKVDVPSEGAV